MACFCYLWNTCITDYLRLESCLATCIYRNNFYLLSPFRKTFRWHLDHNAMVLILVNQFQNVTWEMPTILFRSQDVIQYVVIHLSRFNIHMSFRAKWCSLAAILELEFNIFYWNRITSIWPQICNLRTQISGIILFWAELVRKIVIQVHRLVSGVQKQWISNRASCTWLSVPPWYKG